MSSHTRLAALVRILCPGRFPIVKQILPSAAARIIQLMPVDFLKLYRRHLKPPKTAPLDIPKCFLVDLKSFIHFFFTVERTA